MRTGRSDAIDIFRKWSADGALIRFQGTFFNFAFSSWGKISAIDDNELRIMADDHESELVVRFTSDIQFGYVDSRTVTGEEKGFEESIAIFFNLPAVREPDMITLAALKTT